MIGVRHRAVTDRGGGQVALGFGVAGVAAQICYPLTAGAPRELVTVAVVMLLASACVAHAVAVRGARWAGGLVLITVGGGLLAEFVGTTTGLPFGSYVYTTGGALGWELGPVPLVIGPAWTFGSYLAWCAARAVVAGPGRGAATVVVAAWGLAGWDLYLDPQLVADGRWRWTATGPGLPGVPQVPLSNYAGWLLVGLMLGAALHRMDRALGTPPPTHDALPLALFCWTWLGSAVAHGMFLDLPASAGYGLIGMGLIGVPLLTTRLLRPPTHPPRVGGSGGWRRPDPVWAARADPVRRARVTARPGGPGGHCASAPAAAGLVCRGPTKTVGAGFSTRPWRSNARAACRAEPAPPGWNRTG